MQQSSTAHAQAGTVLILFIDGSKRKVTAYLKNVIV
jgi:hypothetical protein